jgi:hypothetical protein
MSMSHDGTDFHLFDSAGVGLVGVSAEGTIRHTNASLLRYLEVEPDGILGKETGVLKPSLTSPDFWEGLAGEDPFYCLIPARHHLLLALCRKYSGPSAEAVEKVVLLRPYGLEREFIRMRSRLNQNIVLEITSHLNSVAIAGEIILQPELQDDETTRKRFLSTFFGDISGLGELFAELQEIAEPIPFPNRVRPTPLDWKSLVADLLHKIRGLANDRNVSVESDLPEHLASVQGDYHWLYLALYGVLNHAAAEAPVLGEIRVACREHDGSVETTIEYSSDEILVDPSWPPPTLFTLSRDNPRIGKMEISELALSRSIFNLHNGDLEKRESPGKVTFVTRLPA